MPRKKAAFFFFFLAYSSEYANPCMVFLPRSSQVLQVARTLPYATTTSTPSQTLFVQETSSAKKKKRLLLRLGSVSILREEEVGHSVGVCKALKELPVVESLRQFHNRQ